jgi:hypothetical protein
MNAGMSKHTLVFFSVTLSVLFLISCSKDKSFENHLRSKEYILSPVGNSGVNGRIVISENADSSFNVFVSIDPSILDTVHGLNIHNGSITSPGILAIPLAGLTGNGGLAQVETRNITEVMMPDSTVQKISYDGILAFAGYLNVSYSLNMPDSLIAQGNIGSN